MPIVKNDAGLEKVFVDNLEELGDLSARPTITDGDSSVFLHCDTQGRLNVNIRPMDSVNGAGTPTESINVLNVANDGAGTNRIVKCDGNGILQVKEIGSVNMLPANTLNSHITDDPANSIAVGLTGRTTIGTATSQTHLKCTATGDLSVNVDTISKGKDIITDAGGLQQVLLYGKNGSNGNLEPVEMVGDRLLVDVIELSPTGPHTPTSLPSVAIHGQVGTTNGFKNLRVNTDGRLENVINSQTKTINQYASQSLTGNGEWATITDTTGYGKMSIVINSDATTNLMLYASSTNGGSYIPFKSIHIVAEDSGASTHNIGFTEIISPPNFIKIVNTDAGGVVLNIITTLSN